MEATGLSLPTSKCVLTDFWWVCPHFTCHSSSLRERPEHWYSVLALKRSRVRPSSLLFDVTKINTYILWKKDLGLPFFPCCPTCCPHSHHQLNCWQNEMGRGEEPNVRLESAAKHFQTGERRNKLPFKNPSPEMRRISRRVDGCSSYYNYYFNRISSCVSKRILYMLLKGADTTPDCERCRKQRFTEH